MAWTWWPTGSACLRRPPGAGDRIEPARRRDGRGSAASPVRVSGRRPPAGRAERGQRAHRAPAATGPGVRRAAARRRDRLADRGVRRVPGRVGDRRAGRADRPAARADHRLREDRGPHRRQGADRGGTGHAVCPGRAALVGDRGDPGPRARGDRAPVLGDPARGDRGQPGRQDQNRAPGARHLPLRAARAARRRAGGGDGTGSRGPRRRLRDPGRAPAPPMTAPGGPGAGQPGAGEPGAGGKGAAAAALIALLAARGQSIAVAESLTGGLLAAALTDVPGASAGLRGGIVAYATELKAVLLGVDRALLAAQGAVSAEVAGAMAEGVADRLGAAGGAATTGVAGPGPPEGTPAGRVCPAASAGPYPRAGARHLSGGRAAGRLATVR